LVREIEGLLRGYDPGALEVVLGGIDRHNEPRRYLIGLLRSIGRVYSSRSSGTHGRTLDALNQFVKLQDGTPIRGISVELSPVERRVYERDEISLAELPDRSAFLEAMNRITAEVEREAESPEGSR